MGCTVFQSCWSRSIQLQVINISHLICNISLITTVNKMGDGGGEIVWLSKICDNLSILLTPSVAKILLKIRREIMTTMSFVKTLNTIIGGYSVQNCVQKHQMTSLPKSTQTRGSS